MRRYLKILPVLGLLAIAACTNPDDVDGPLRDMGNFRLGHNVAVSSKAVRGPMSREASEEEWNDTMHAAIAERFGRYEGDKLYHLGVSIEGYVIAAPGVPLVLSPKSILIVNVTAWDDAAGKKLNEKPKQITVFESFDAGSAVVGSGYTQSREEQMQNLARNAAKEIQNWLLQNREWFGDAEMPATGTTTGTATMASPDEEPSVLPATSPAASAPVMGAAATVPAAPAPLAVARTPSSAVADSGTVASVTPQAD